MTNNTRKYGIYEVVEEFKPDGSWAGFRCRCVDSSGQKQGKLYLQSDGREHYREKKDEELEI